MAFFLKVLAGGKIAKMFGGPKSTGKEDSGSRTTRQFLGEETKKISIFETFLHISVGDPNPD
jgi:hypothetical protein